MLMIYPLRAPNLACFTSMLIIELSFMLVKLLTGPETLNAHTVPSPDGYMDVAGRVTQEAKAELRL